jgi:hypothetical protein
VPAVPVRSAGRGGQAHVGKRLAEAVAAEEIQEARQFRPMADAGEALAADTPERQVQLAGLAEVARSLEGRQGDIPSAGRLVAEALG